MHVSHPMNYCDNSGMMKGLRSVSSGWLIVTTNAWNTIIISLCSIVEWLYQGVAEQSIILFRAAKLQCRLKPRNMLEWILTWTITTKATQKLAVLASFDFVLIFWDLTKRKTKKITRYSYRHRAFLDLRFHTVKGVRKCKKRFRKDRKMWGNIH